MNLDNSTTIYLTSKESKARIKKIPESELLHDSNAESRSIKVDKNLTRQSILGFGGAFTEASASIYDQLETDKKNEIIQAYFGDSGNQYNMGRTHINSCDFSLGNYALCEKEDRKLTDFSIERDKKMLIPFIKEALNKASSPILLMASPWSPPPWMKTNDQMNHGGKLKQEFQDTWAEYYCKYIEFYERDGVPIWGISVQNEPEAVQTWDSCIYTGEEERDFIKNFLGPALERNKYLDKKLVIWDHNRDVMVERSRAVLSDPDAAKYVWGTGFHWYNGDHFDEVQKVHDEFPDKELIFTEGCQEGGPHNGSWDLGERYATSIINDLNRYTVAWIDWNLLLDERGGPNHVGNYCSAPIIVNTKTQELLYQSSYFYLGHFSRFFSRGDKIIECENTSNQLLSLSGINKNARLTTTIMNKEKDSIPFLYDNGSDKKSYSIPPRSIITIIND
ncbi:MAG: glycoside hydrolase family 30 protein [Candidatus Neomarinimicrobiota bacterium]